VAQERCLKALSRRHQRLKYVKRTSHATQVFGAATSFPRTTKSSPNSIYLWGCSGADGGARVSHPLAIAHPDTEAPGWVHRSDVYNALVTMHGTIMVFFVAMPILLAAFGNFSSVDDRRQGHGFP